MVNTTYLNEYIRENQWEMCHSDIWYTNKLKYMYKYSLGAWRMSMPVWKNNFKLLTACISLSIFAWMKIVLEMSIDFDVFRFKESINFRILYNQYGMRFIFKTFWKDVTSHRTAIMILHYKYWKYFCRDIAIDEIRIQHYMVETKQQSSNGGSQLCSSREGKVIFVHLL